MEQNNETPKQQLTPQEELREKVAQYYKAFSEWLAFDKDESIGLNILRLFYKIPIAIFAVFVSPILFVFIIITFFAAF